MCFKSVHIWQFACSKWGDFSIFSNGHSDGMAGPILTIFEDFIGTIWSFTWEKIEKNRKINSKNLVKKFQTLDPYRFLSIWPRMLKMHRFEPDFVGLHCVWIWSKSVEKLWRYPDKTWKSGFLRPFVTYDLDRKKKSLPPTRW